MGPDTPAPTTGRRGRGRLRSRAWRITALYALFATLWIVFSDRALSVLVSDPELLVRWSVYKGIAFVTITSALLLLMMMRVFGTIESGYARLQAHKHQIERFNRLYVAFSQINQAITQSASRETLYREVCGSLVEQGGFRMAWLAEKAAEGDGLQPMAASGSGTDCIENLLAHRCARPVQSRQWRQLLDEGQPAVCNDLLEQAEVSAWRGDAQRHGFKSSAAFAVRHRGQVLGVLAVYADEADFFRSKEIELLAEVAADVSRALDNFALAEERRQAEALAVRESEFSAAVLESMPGILYFYDKQGRFLRWNRNFEQISGYSREEIAAMHPLQFFDGDHRALLEHRIAEVFELGESSVEAPFLAKDGSRTPHQFTGRRVEFNGMTCLAGVGIDISHRKQAEEALRELNETLEQKVAERTAELQVAVTRAEAADRLKSAFLATMSHELRTPLNSIIGFTGIVLQELAGPLTPEQAKQLGMVRKSARHLLELINDILDLSKIEAGQLEVHAEPFDLQASIENVVALVQPQARQKSLRLETSVASPLPPMVGDQRRVEQVLLNLLSNAIKFTDRGEVRLTIDVHEEPDTSADSPAGPYVCLCVTDTGMGIKPEELSTLFQPFHQLDSGLTRQHEGTGLGLAICRRLTHLMGGSITAGSKWATGSEFTVTLPLQGSGDA